MHRVWNDERVSHGIGGPRTEEQLQERIGRWTRHWEEHGFGATLFTERASGDAIGWGGLQHSTIGIGERLTVGYVVAPEVWVEGMHPTSPRPRSCTPSMCSEPSSCTSSVLSTNAASRRVLEKAGLRVDRDVDHGDHIEVIYVAVSVIEAPSRMVRLCRVGSSC